MDVPRLPEAEPHEPSLTVRTAVEAFVAWCREHRARNTCLLYRSRLASLAVDLGDQPLAAISRPIIEAWLAKADRFPDGRLKSPDTRRANAIAFKQFQAWCVDQGHLAAVVIAKINKPMGRQRQRVPTSAETLRLLERAPEAFRVMYQALRLSGARPGELCGAQIADWRVDQKAIVVREHKTAAKTGNDRRIAVGAKLAEVLQAAIGERVEGPIFLSPAGRPWKPQRLSTVYRRLRDAAGLPRDLCLYLARHEHGTQICRRFGIKAAADALGHTSIKTTQRYAHSTDDERAANQDAFE